MVIKCLKAVFLSMAGMTNVYLLPKRLVEQIKHALASQPVVMGSSQHFPHGRVYFKKNNHIYTRVLDEKKKSIPESEMVVLELKE